ARVVDLVRNLLRETGLRNVVLSGGVASNIKANRLIRNLPEVDDLFVFPHMGDGGQAVGAACIINNQMERVSVYRANSFYLGPSYSEEHVQSALEGTELSFTREKDIVGEAARLIANGKILFWFQGRMEFGPRALGARSILALPGSL